MNLGLLAIGTDDDDAIVISNTTTHNDNSLEYENSLEFENSNDSLERRRKKPPNMMWKNSNDCGVRDRIIGGDVGTAGEFPWLVALKLRYHFRFSVMYPRNILMSFTLWKHFSLPIINLSTVWIKAFFRSFLKKKF